MNGGIVVAEAGRLRKLALTQPGASRTGGRVGARRVDTLGASMTHLVLIVSADPEIAHRVKRVAECEGAEVLAAADEREAMRLFVLREPDLTLIDVRPGVRAGLELCRDMKTLQIGRRVVVVVLAPKESRSEAFGVGCDAFVADPADDRRIIRTIRRFSSVSRRPARSRSTIALSP